MALEDPFLIAKNEIVVSMDKARLSYEKWLEYRNALEEAPESDKDTKVDFDGKTLELRNQIRSLEWDVEDMEETYTMYESYPAKMKLSDDEVKARGQFIKDIKEELRQLKDEVFDPKYNVKERSVLDNLFSNPIGYYSITFDGATGGGNNRYKRLDDDNSHNAESNNNNLNRGKKGESRVQIDTDDGIPSNDLRLAREIEQMMEEENGEMQNQLINDFGYPSDDYNQVYQPTLNVITDPKYDSPLKRMVRALHWTNTDHRTRYGMYTFLAVASLVTVVLFSFW